MINKEHIIITIIITVWGLFSEKKVKLGPQANLTLHFFSENNPFTVVKKSNPSAPQTWLLLTFWNTMDYTYNTDFHDILYPPNFEF